MSQEAEDILRGRSLLNRHLYQQRIADTAEAQSEQHKPTTYTAFDPELGLGRLKDSSGNISYGIAQTNGAVGTGENIRLRRGGVIAGYDSMPRRKAIPSFKESQKPIDIKLVWENIVAGEDDIYISSSNPIESSLIKKRKIEIESTKIIKFHPTTFLSTVYFSRIINILLFEPISSLSFSAKWKLSFEINLAEIQQFHISGATNSSADNNTFYQEDNLSKAQEEQSFNFFISKSGIPFSKYLDISISPSKARKSTGLFFRSKYIFKSPNDSFEEGLLKIKFRLELKINTPPPTKIIDVFSYLPNSIMN